MYPVCIYIQRVRIWICIRMIFGMIFDKTKLNSRLHSRKINMLFWCVMDCFFGMESGADVEMLLLYYYHWYSYDYDDLVLCFRLEYYIKCILFF